MRILIFLSLLFLFPLYAQDGTNTNSSEVGATKEKELAKAKDDILKEEDGLDKEFFDYYVNTLPQKEKQTEKGLERERLLSNLLGIFKKEIVRQDAQNGKEAVKGIDDKSMKYQKVTWESDWLRRLQKEIGKRDRVKLVFTDHMFFVRYQRYMAVLTFRIDPRKHYLSEAEQIELLIIK